MQHNIYRHSQSLIVQSFVLVLGEFEKLEQENDFDCKITVDKIHLYNTHCVHLSITDLCTHSCLFQSFEMYQVIDPKLC